MALSRIVALLSLLLLADALPFRADLLLDLATRRNMALLCHAILLLLLLGVPSPAARRRRQQQHSTEYYSAHHPERSHYHTIRMTVPAAVDSVSRIDHQQQLVATKEIVLVEEKQKGSCSYYYYPTKYAAAAQPAPTDDDDIVSSIDFAPATVALLPDDQHKNGAEEHAELEGESSAAVEFVQDQEEEEEDDLDEMNRRFEAFIAATKEKMRLEALHPALHVPSSSGGNTPLLAR